MCLETIEQGMSNIEIIGAVAKATIAIAAVVGLFITGRSLYNSVNQFKEQLQLTVFTDYTKRYQEIMLNFPENINQDDFDFDSLDKDDETIIKDKTLRYMRAYFDLCSEEFFLHKEGKIGDNTWVEWKSGIEYAFTKSAFKKGWKIVKFDTGYYPDFVGFVENILGSKKT